MKDHLVFYLSAYLLFALFFIIYIFTAGILAKGMAAFFALSIVVPFTYINKAYIQEVLFEITYRFHNIIQEFYLH